MAEDYDGVGISSAGNSASLNKACREMYKFLVMRS